MSSAEGFRGTAEERFFAKVTEGPGDCWSWAASDNGAGYGRFFVSRRKVYAHRWSWEFFRGEIPEGLHLDHLCRNRACVNPEHLDPVPNRVNLRRGTHRNTAKTHCSQGHELSGDNLDRSRIQSGERHCRICKNAAQREYAARKRAAATPTKEIAA